MLPRTPQEFLDKKKIDYMPAMNQSAVIEQIARVIHETNSTLNEFDVVMGDHVFHAMEPAGKSSAPSDDVDYTNAAAWVAVELQITDKVSKSSKFGMATFEVINNDLHFRGRFKGVDNVIYGLNEEGLASYFSTERNVSDQKPVQFEESAQSWF